MGRAARRADEAALLERVFRLAFHVGLPMLERNPVRVVFGGEAGPAARGVVEVAMTPPELRRVDVLSRRLGLSREAVIGRAVRLGHEAFAAMDLEQQTAAAAAAKESLSC
jgi:hypothetical protein